MTDLVLLSLLLDGPRYGYELKKQAGLILGIPQVHNNVVYPLLRRFTEKGWVRRQEIPGEKGPKRQNYFLTQAGRKYFLSQLSGFSEREARSETAFQFRVGLFNVLPAEARRRILVARENVIEERTERLQAILSHFSPENFPREVIAFRLRNLHAELLWIKRLSEMTNQRRRNNPKPANSKTRGRKQ